MIPYMIVYSDSLKTTVIFVWVQIWFLYDLIIVWDFSWIFSFFFFSKRNFVEFYWVCGGGGDSTQTNTHTGQQKKKKKKHWVGVVNCCKNFFFFLFHTRQSSYENGYLNLGGERPIRDESIKIDQLVYIDIIYDSQRVHSWKWLPVVDFYPQQ